MVSDSAAATIRAREGTTLGGRYVLGALLGEGAMGAVFEAEHRWTHRRVAVKLLWPEYGARADAVARFVQEARAAAAIDHPNIVVVLDFDREDERTVFLVMERLDGESLEAHLARGGRLSPGDAAALLAPVLDALEHAHALGIVHRDVKPANIFLARAADGSITPKLLDFGVAKMMDGSGLAATRSGMILGTPAYMAPEQGDDGARVDGRADVWSVGVVLYECLSGRLPYIADSLQRLLVAVATSDPPRLDAVAPHLAGAITAVVHRALSRDLAARWPSALALRDALRDAVATVVRAPTPAALATPRGRRRWPLLLGLALAVAIVATWTAAIARRRSATRPSSVRAPSSVDAGVRVTTVDAGSVAAAPMATAAVPVADAGEAHGRARPTRRGPTARTSPPLAPVPESIGLEE